MPAFDRDAFDPDAFDTEGLDPPVDPDNTDRGVTSGSGYSFVPTSLLRSGLGLGAYTFTEGQDRLLDEVTHDYIRTANGEWVETKDSRTKFLIAMKVAIGQSIFDSEHGTSIDSRRHSGSLTSPEYLQSETVRVGSTLAAEGTLTDLVVTVRDEDGNALRDQSGRLVVRASWRDLGSGAFVETTFPSG